MLKLLKYVLIPLILIIILFCIIYYFHYQTIYPETKDAYLHVNMLQVAPSVSGPLKALYVHNQETVQKGQALFLIDPKPYELAVQTAQAQLKQTQQTLRASQSAILAAKHEVEAATIQYHLAQQNYQRILPLVQAQDATTAEGDQAFSAVKSARVQILATQSKLAQLEAQTGPFAKDNPSLKAAEAALAQARYRLQHTLYHAPITGEVVNLELTVGTVISPEKIIFSIIPTNTTYEILANFKETQLNHIHIGAPVTVHLPMYPKLKIKGIVTSIALGSQSTFSLIPTQNSTGNFVPVAERFKVTIKLLTPNDPKHPYRVGATCYVRIR